MIRDMTMKFEERGLSRQRPGKIFCKQEDRGEHVRLHYHSSLEISFPHNLRGSVALGEHSFDLAGKRSVIIPPGELHSYAIDPSPGGYVYVCHLSVPLLEPVVQAEALEDHYPRVSCSADPLEETLRLVRRKQGLITPVETARLLFTLLDTRAARHPRGLLSSSLRGDLPAMRRVIDYVEHHYEKPITLQQAAEIAGKSRSAFAERFSAVTGMSFHRFLLQVRLEYSCIHLSGGETVTRTACRCGFTDASHFIRCFKSYYRQTPLAFQKAMR